MNWTNYAFTGFETTAGTQGRKGTGAPTGPVQNRVGEKSGVFASSGPGMTGTGIKRYRQDSIWHTKYLE